MKNKILNLPFFIIFLSAFPALALLVNNLGQTALWVVRRPLIASIFISALLSVGSWLLVRRWQQASLCTAWALLLFFTYGHVYQFVEGFELFGYLLGRHRYLVVAWGVLFIIGIYRIMRKRQVSNQLIHVLNGVSLLLVVFQIVQIGIYQFRKGNSQRLAQESEGDLFLNPSDPSILPDVYLIILDKYGREDALLDRYHYDNHEFISQLKELGFYVADCARSNYSHTLPSLTSQLNLNYADELLNEINHEALAHLFKNNLVVDSVKKIGYKTISFDTHISWANLDQTDIFYTRPPTGQNVSVLNPFEELYIKGTFARLYLDYYISQNLARYIRLWTRIEMKAQQTRLILDGLKQIPALEGPKFTVAHILAFHSPWVFNSDGSINYEGEIISDFEGLPIQLDYLNPQIIDILEYIIDKSDPEPIVILEADHGFARIQRNSILNALYLPGDGKELLYPQISLVNTFRIVFNRYFGTNLSLLEDLTFIHTADDDLYNFIPNDEWNPACIP